ncbi:MAG TPA: hypothetical protein ENG13_03530 [bacterium]|nr:hypothetical protein [bacterium]HEX68119.1 hypothetical protein [bacterium]
MRYRWMFYLTGLPGWMRFGFSPGWIGRSPTGLGPAATYLLYGTWPTPQMQAFWQAFQSGYTPFPAFGFPFANPPTPEDELTYLRQQQELLEDQLESIRKRIEELEGKK